MANDKLSYNHQKNELPHVANLVISQCLMKTQGRLNGSFSPSPKVRGMLASCLF